MDIIDEEITADVKFAQIPHWVLELPLTDKAVRLYAILSKYADNEDRTSYPGRGTLAKLMRCHRTSVDRAVEELMAAGCISKQRRVVDGRYTSSLYTVHRIPPRSTSEGSRTHATTPVAPMRLPPSHPCDIELEPKNVEPKNIEKPKQTSMKDDWQPEPANWQTIIARHPNLDCQTELDNFRDHWIGKGERRANWNASLRTWMRNAEKWQRVNPADPPKNKPANVGPNGRTFCDQCRASWAQHDQLYCDLQGGDE
jgi:predicted transcriptional regulator